MPFSSAKRITASTRPRGYIVPPSINETTAPPPTRQATRLFGAPGMSPAVVASRTTTVSAPTACATVIAPRQPTSSAVQKAK